MCIMIPWILYTFLKLQKLYHLNIDLICYMGMLIFITYNLFNIYINLFKNQFIFKIM